MNREIKFRAFIKELRTMHKVLELYHDGGVMVEGYEYPLSAEQIALIQYAGLKDKSGVEIYESGIMRGKSKVFGVIIGVVVFSEYLDGEEYIHGCHLGWNIDGIPLKDLVSDGLEIIGNIYENPELLEANK